MKNSPKIRLFCEAVPAVGQTLDLPEKAVHYLLNVMKLGRGDTLLLFDNRHGEFAAEITETGKKLCRTLITEQTAPFSTPISVTIACLRSRCSCRSSSCFICS